MATNLVTLTRTVRVCVPIKRKSTSQLFNDFFDLRAVLDVFKKRIFTTIQV